MRKTLITIILLAFLGGFMPFTTSAASFIFTDNFDKTTLINPNTTRAPVRNGRVFTEDNSSASRVESKTVKRTSFDITEIAINVTESLPSGSRIIYFASNDGGKTWIQLIPGYVARFNQLGKDLRWAAVLARSSINSESPFIESITLSFKEGGERLKNKNDGTRISDLRRVSSGLNAYFKERGNYPTVSGQSASARWNELEAILERKNSDGRALISVMPKPINSVDGSIVDYDYVGITGALNELFGFGYILSAGMESANYSALKNDPDGKWGPVDCNDPVFCIIQGVSKQSQADTNTFVIKGSAVVNIPKGSLVRALNDYKVYYITKGGVKRHVPNEKVFFSYGNKWSDVLTIPPGAAGSLGAFPDNKFIYLEGQWPRKVYFIENGFKYFVPDSLLGQLRLNEYQIAPVNKTELDSYPIDVINETKVKVFAN